MDSGDRCIFIIVAAVISGVFCLLGGIVGCSIHKSGRTLVREKIVYGTGGTTLSREIEETTYPMKD